LNILAGRHEPFREIINRFGLLLCRQAELRSHLPLADVSAVTVDEDRFLGGEPLVACMDSELFVPAFKEAALRIWPVMGVLFPALSESLADLGRKLEDQKWIGLCLRAVARGDAEALDQAAARAAVSPEFLLTAVRTAYGPCIAAHKPAMLALAPADLWRKAHCPVCGSDPDMSTLENHPDPSEFLISKSGELWQHCPICAHHWRFARITCSGCGNQDHERMTRFSLPDSPREHIYACEACRQYLPCLDLVESSEKLDLDLAALGLVHLDAVAQSRGYTPLSPAPWTALGLAEEAAKAS
ncbi:MAG: formate dehydrogenase accessory protein FdhE, partial [Desulfomicrobium sp.]|nr:formate dehydrogenase accessory protein FdhE [Desulfomicrobium sp.]